MKVIGNTMQTKLKPLNDKRPPRGELQGVCALVAAQQKAFFDSMFVRQKADSTFWDNNDERIQKNFNNLIAVQRQQLVNLYGDAFAAQVMGCAETRLLELAAEYAVEDAPAKSVERYTFNYNKDFAVYLPLIKLKGTV